MKQRNFVAKHARSCGAGRHTVRTKYSRKQKHKGGCMNFHQGEAGFAHKGWSVTITRSRLGNKMDGHRYLYSFRANKCEQQGDVWIITNRIQGEGGKREALNAIKKQEAE
jgi:hypothetical protein